MLTFNVVTENVRAWMDRRERAVRNREILQLAREQVAYFEEVGDVQSVKFWSDVIDGIKHQVRL
jgi:hypothetical protein